MAPPLKGNNMAKHNNMVIPRRKTVFDFVTTNPGATPAQVCRELEINLTSVQDLLNWFVFHGIMSHQEQRGPRGNEHTVIGEYSAANFVPKPEPIATTPMRLMSSVWAPQYANQIFNQG